MKLFAGNSNRVLAEAVARYLNIQIGRASVRRFADQEIFVEIQENVRGEDVFVLQSTSYPANDHLMELLIMIDAFRRSSARRITAVIPYFGYARQDRRASGRTPISAKLVANLITRAGADRVLTLDLHAGQIQGFFDIPTDNLFAVPVMARDMKAEIQAVQRHGRFARRRRRGAGARAGQAHRRATRHRRQAARAAGRIRGDEHHRRRRAARTACSIDDIVNSGGTLCNAADALLADGAASVTAYITHGVLSGGAVRKDRRLQAEGAGDHQFDPADRRASRRPTTSASSRSPT